MAACPRTGPKRTGGTPPFSYMRPCPPRAPTTDPHAHYTKKSPCQEIRDESAPVFHPAPETSDPRPTFPASRKLRPEAPRSGSGPPSDSGGAARIGAGAPNGSHIRPARPGNKQIAQKFARSVKNLWYGPAGLRIAPSRSGPLQDTEPPRGSPNIARSSTPGGANPERPEDSPDGIGSSQLT